jgi:histidinol-phosphate aminotransferase
MNAVCDLAPQNIHQIAPYQPGKPIAELQRELGLSEIIKLASNENPLGYGSKARAAIEAAFSDLSLYPDGNGFELKTALMEHHGVGRDQIILGNGSNDILELAARTFLTAQSSAVYSAHAFAVYPLVVKAVGAEGIEVPARNFGHDLDAMARAIRPDTRIVFIANPNNPTGTFLPGNELLEGLRKIPAHVLVVLDEAYTEYLEAENRYDAVSWLAQFPNLLISRTFSKAYGLAGLRVGFGLGNAAVVDLMNRIRQPFNVNSMALAAAVAALDDQAFLEQTRQTNLRGLRQLEEGFKQLSLPFIPSVGNFISVEVGAQAPAIYQDLLKQGVIVRPVGNYQMPRHLRITVGLPQQNEFFLKALASALSRSAN